MALPVAEVEDQPNQQPDNQPHPIGPAEAVNHGTADNDTQRRNNRQRWHTEASFYVRAPPPHNPHTRAHKNESEQSSNAGHLARDVRRNERRDQAGEDKEEQVGFVGRSKPPMHIRKSSRDRKSDV